MTLVSRTQIEALAQPVTALKAIKPLPQIPQRLRARSVDEELIKVNKLYKKKTRTYQIFRPHPEIANGS